MNHPYNVIPTEVFHYTKKTIALEKILFEKKIKLGQFEFTNDPRETKERLFHFISSKGNKYRSKENANWIRDEVVRIINQEWKLLCVSLHHPKLNPPHVSILDRHEILNPNDSSSLYFNTFMAGSYRPRMWAQYAENHQGVCLKFNGTKLNDQIQNELRDRCEIFYGEVLYSDESLLERFTVDLFDVFQSEQPTMVLRKLIRENYERLFFCKANDWETEHEWRWLVWGKENSAEYVSIEGVIEEVLIGVDFPKVYLPSLIKICEELDIPAGRMIWANGVPYLEPEIIYKP
jgi:hypothetical protein